MIFWLIFASLLITLSIPLFIPFRLRARWETDGDLEWRASYGTLQLAPDSKVHIDAFLTRWKRFGKITAWPLIQIFKIIVLLFGLLFSLAKLIIKPFILLFRMNKKKRRSSDPTFEALDEQSKAPRRSTDKDDIAGSGDEDLATKLDDEEHEVPFSEFREETRDSEMTIESKEEFEDEDATESLGDDTEPPPQFDDFEPLPDSASDEYFYDQQEPRAKPESNLQKALSFSKKMQRYYDLFGVLGKRTLRSLFKLLGRYIRAFKFGLFEIQLKMGGDPVLLGTLLGWFATLDGALEGKPGSFLIFQPDFDEEAFALEGKLNIDVHVSLISFIFPTAIFLVSLPYIGFYKAYKQMKQEQVP